MPNFKVWFGGFAVRSQVAALCSGVLHLLWGPVRHLEISCSIMKAHNVIPETMSKWDFAQIITHKCSGRRDNIANSTITKAVSQYVPRPLLGLPRSDLMKPHQVNLWLRFQFLICNVPSILQVSCNCICSHHFIKYASDVTGVVLGTAKNPTMHFTFPSLAIICFS